MSAPSCGDSTPEPVSGAETLQQRLGRERRHLCRGPLAPAPNANAAISKYGEAGPTKPSRLEEGSAKLRGGFLLCPASARTLKMVAEGVRLSQNQVVESAANTRHHWSFGRIRSPLSPPPKRLLRQPLCFRVRRSAQTLPKPSRSHAALGASSSRTVSLTTSGASCA